MTFMWFGQGKSFRLRSFAMTGAFLVFPLVCMFPYMCLGTEPSKPLADARRNNSFQHTRNYRTHRHERACNLGPGISVPGTWDGYSFYRTCPLLFYSSRLKIVQFITVHFYRAIRYGFHRYVPPSQVPNVIHLCKDEGVPLRVLLSFPLAHQVCNSKHSHNVPNSIILIGFTALTILQLGSWGRKM